MTMTAFWYIKPQPLFPKIVLEGANSTKNAANMSQM